MMQAASVLLLLLSGDLPTSLACLSACQMPKDQTLMSVNLICIRTHHARQ
jgi:hypothetical protein